ncbi:3-oxoacyl-ACP synthase [Ruminococcaceae bacterium OttesenSCG-928-A16]|nr:3-oxoacyl-ACP synthase [Ruminococcaceae bacterium OttesenSCG-928-A16]
MLDPNFKVGIVDYTLYTPEQTITAEELAPLVNVPADVLRNKMGINKKHVGGPDDQPGIMATKCATQLIEKTGFDPKDIDMILYAGETYAEYICWTVALKVQNEIGAENAYAWDLGFRCAGLPLGLKIAKEMMYADKNLKNVLVCGGNNNCSLVDYKDPLQSFMFNMSPGAFAALLRRDYDQNLILDSGIFTDSSFYDDVIGVTGGSLNPLTQEMVEEMAKDPEKTRRFSLLTLPDGAGMKKRLGERSLPDFIKTVNLACKRNGIQSSDIDFIGLVHIGNRAHYALMDSLGIDHEKTVFLWDDGHCGHADPLLALNYGIKEGKVKDGDLCALVGAGTGYVFGCTIVQWGKAQ